MIHNAVIHINNEQPLLCDLYEMPAAGDVSLVCTNLRTMNGTRPVFVDNTASVFVFPYGIVRFIEIPQAAIATGSPGAALDEAGRAGDPVPVGPDGAAVDADPDADLEIDEDFLRRIRDI